MTIVINMFAGPGAGKSTTAAHLFALMKHMGKSVELVTEWCKLFAYRPEVFPSQEMILQTQVEMMSLPFGEVDYIVTDSPVLSGIMYGTKPVDAWRYHALFSPSFNVFLQRVKPYSQSGRFQTEEEARVIDHRLRDLLAFDFIVSGNEQAAETILRNLPNIA